MDVEKVYRWGVSEAKVFHPRPEPDLHIAFMFPNTFFSLEPIQPGQLLGGKEFTDLCGTFVVDPPGVVLLVFKSFPYFADTLLDRLLADQCGAPFERSRSAYRESAILPRERAHFEFRGDREMIR
ncbi:hypothetical protein AXG93_1247s1270 [Marchantia polymorpha subsp. ruderalis]|uniref:Uncharacterized protein n=1 Tax=Marchantia polymorpha subsp. ruderalis TaxID=1480154 RepID=A0A176WNW9_MARPO|nr:hypothetical protein AXG93_1247s1270 [Marchantia polymorpha subsp. ruderalis]